MLDSNWFSEPHAPAGSAISFRIKQKLHSEKSEFQQIDIYETHDWGNLMVIDDCVMLTTRDNFLYHEMMSHPALFVHARAKRVIVIGGGDCGTLKEVLKHEEVEEAIQVEIDERVTRLSEQYFPELCTSNSDPRAKLLFIDGIKFMAEAEPESIDVIIVDSTDPIGPAEGLFNEAFYQTCVRALKPGGILVQQSESPLVHMYILAPMRASMKDAGFAAVRTLLFPQPAYPTGWWSCTMARKGDDLSSFRERDASSKPFRTRYYNTDIHRAAMALPEFVREAFGE